jgi:enoyl-CoA hydratase/carnithine racemase
MDFQTIICEKKGCIGYVTLNRPRAHNTINSTMNRELEAAWGDFAQDDDIWVGVVTGAGERAFCVGMDLSDSGMGFGSQPTTPPQHKWTAREAGSYKPVVTAVNGMCCAAGFYFIKDSAITIASENATFFDPHVDIGFVAGNSLAAMSHFLPVGPVLRMFLMGRSEQMPAQRAYEIGLVTEVVPLSRLRDRASEIAEILASKAPLGTRATLEVVWQGLNMGLDAATEHSHQISMGQRRFEDFYEGIRAFNEKRQPRWQAK